MLRIIIGISVTALSTFIGKKYTDKYCKRYSFLKALCDFNSALLRDVKFKKNGILDVLGDDFGNKDFDVFIHEYKLAMESGSNLPTLPDYLDDKDKEEIDGYFIKIGKSSSVSEYNFLLLKREEFAERCSELKIESQKYSSLGTRLGFILGVTVFIIII